MAAFASPPGNRLRILARDEAPARLHAAWSAARASWTDRARHEELVAIAVEVEGFAWLATRYRELANTGDEIATQQLARISRAAQVALTISALARRADEPDKTPYRSVQILIAVLVMTMAGTWIYARLHEPSALATSATKSGPRS